MMIKEMCITVLLASMYAPSGFGSQAEFGSGSPIHTAANGPRLFAEGIISTSDDEFNTTFTPDGKTIYFTKGVPVNNMYVICVSHFRNGTWSVPEVAPFSGQYRDTDPFITADGSQLFFVSNRPLSGSMPKNDNDIWVMNKTPQGWSRPENLGSAINTDTNEQYPSLTKDGALYFSSARPGGMGADDIYRSRFI